MNLRPSHIWNAWREVRNQTVTTRVKHIVLVALIGTVAFVGIVYQIQQINAHDRAGDQRAAALEAYSAAKDTYNTQVVQYNACVASIESREATRADNERDNNVLRAIAAALAERFGDDPFIIDLQSIIEQGAQLDDQERPQIDPATCPPPPVAPEAPNLD